MKCKKISYKVLLNIPLLLIILGLRLNIYLSEAEEHYEYDNPTYIEVVSSDGSNNESFLSKSNYYFNYTFDNVCEVPVFNKYKYAILSYNQLVLTQYKVLDSNTSLNSNIISILKHHNISNKSPDEKPETIC
ncbi:MAG: hypothetical protein C0597_00160 [Marinilabiliales bacterium]|nr:MAG: hypothetical protein C0597_00160 [Marinilabiliales bacterium]